MRLSDLCVGQYAYIRRVHGTPAYVRRLAEMGFVEGAGVKVETKAPMADPIEYVVKGTSITLRRSEAYDIEIAMERGCCGGCPGCTDHLMHHMQLHDQHVHAHCAHCHTMTTHHQDAHWGAHSIDETRAHHKELTVALVGNPNCGKTTLFNKISGGHEHEGNYCGVTVDSKEGFFSFQRRRIRLVDLPGTYSLAAFSPEERYVEDYLRKHHVDVILNVVDSTNLQRNLFLTTQLYSMNIPMVCALNMYDVLEQQDRMLEIPMLTERLGIPCNPVDARSGKGLQELFRNVLNAHDYPFRYPVFQKDGDAAENFAFVEHVLDGIYRQQTEKERSTARIDRVLTHRIWGYPIFFGVLLLMFQVTYVLGDYPMGWIENLVSLVSDGIRTSFPDGWFKDLLVDGVIGGVGGVIVFLPNILILYFCISLMEDSGYMARAAYIMDRLMRAFGLHGKSFIPMVMAFGCNVPAVMATRAIENRKNRLITMLVTPFMSCSARLPVYLVICGALFPRQAGLILFVLYVTGILVAIICAKLMNTFLPCKDDTPFLMELPNYRLPYAMSLLRHTWERGQQYLRKMGTIILGASLCIWMLSYFPHNESLTIQQQQEQSYIGRLGHFVEPLFEPMGANWKMDVGLISGLGAKEIVVSTLGVLYSGQETDVEDAQQATLLSQTISREITPLSGFCFMLFSLLYFPCIATVAAISREAGHWKWALFSVCYSTALAWVAATVVYQLGRLFF